MSLNFAHNPASAQRSIVARWKPEEERRLPYLEYCDLDKFLALLVKRHGEQYLQRPDGEMLAYRRPDGHTAGTVVVVPPSSAPKRFTGRDRITGAQQLITEALADGPKSIDELVEITGLKPHTIQNNFSADRGKTWRNIDAGWWRLAEGDEIGQEVASQTKAPVPEAAPAIRHLLPTARVEAALAAGPLTISELSEVTGLGSVAVSGALNRSKGRKFRRMNLRSKNDKWQLATATDGEERAQAPLLIDQMIAFLKVNGPSTTHEIADALGRKRNAISATCYKSDAFVPAGKRHNRRMWVVKDE